MSHPPDPRRYSSQSKRPASIAELAERALDNLWDENKDLRHYLRVAEKYRRDGKEFVRTGDLENAFVQFARAATLVLEKLPLHRDYYTLLKPAQRQNMGLNGQDILDNLGDLKPILVDRFDKWLQAHPDGIDNERTPDPNLPHLMPDDAQAQAAAEYHEEEQRPEQRSLAAEVAAQWRRQQEEEEELTERTRKDAMAAAREAADRHRHQQEEMRKRKEEQITRRRREAKRMQEQEAIGQRQHEAENAAMAARPGPAGPRPVRQAAFPQQTASSSSVYHQQPPAQSHIYPQAPPPLTINYSQRQQQAPISPTVNYPQQQPPAQSHLYQQAPPPSTINYSQQQQQTPTSSSANYPQQQQRTKTSSTINYPPQQRPDGIDNERTPDGNLPHPMPDDAQAQEVAQYHEEEQRLEQRRLAAEEAARWRSGDNSIGHGPVRLPSWRKEQDRRRQEDETLSRLVRVRRRSFNESEKRKPLKKEKLRTEAEGGDYGTVDADEEEEEERKGQEEEETGKTDEDGFKRKQAEDTRQGSQDWDSSDGHISCDGLLTTKAISVPLLQCVPLPDDSVPHSGSIQDRLSRLDEMNPSESRILLFEKIHQEMWAELPAIGFIKWGDLPWPVFVRTTCPEDLMLHRIVSYLLQVSSGMDIKAALVDSSRLQRAQQRLRVLLGQWGQPGLQKKVENSADKAIIQGVNVVTNHLESLLDFVNTHQIDEKHHTELTTIVSQSFLKHVSQGLVRILTNTSDNSGYKSLLRLEGDSAQKVLNFLQMLLDCSKLVSLPRNDILGALLRLSKLSKLYPECLTITDLERDDYVVDSGHFGEIYKGRSRNQAICLKIIKVNRKTQIKHLLKTVFKEALLWGHLSHPNILPFYGIYHLKDMHERISFISPWMENGNITEYLKRHPLANRLLLIWDIILGIQFLHQNQVIHGDLKGLNVLVNRSGRACLADFGLANLVDEDILRWTSIQTTGHQSSGTLRWQAPELIDPPSDESAKATRASDIYSFACVCYEIYAGHIPFHRIIRDGTVIKKVLEGSRPPRPADTSLLSDEIWKVIEMCWNQESQDRPNAELVIEQLPLAGIVDDRPNGDDHVAPSDFRAENLGVVFDPAVDIILSSVLRSTRTNEVVEPHAI